MTGLILVKKSEMGSEKDIRSTRALFGLTVK